MREIQNSRHFFSNATNITESNGVDVTDGATIARERDAGEAEPEEHIEKIVGRKQNRKLGDFGDEHAGPRGRHRRTKEIDEGADHRGIRGTPLETLEKRHV